MDTPSANIVAIILFFFILMHGFFVFMELALTEARKGKIEKLADAGDPNAERVLPLLEESENILVTLQIGITLTGILIGSATGARLAPITAAFLQPFPYVSQFSFEIGFCLSLGLVTYATLVFGKCVPKCIALNEPEQTVMRFASFLRMLDAMVRPLASLLSSTTNFVLLFFGVNTAKDIAVTEDEVRTLIEQGTEEGTFEKSEQDMVGRIFHLSDQNAYALMMPRTRMLWIDLEDSLEHNLSIVRENPDTVFPVGKESLDDFVGILYAKDLLDWVLSGKSPTIEACVRTPMFIPKSMNAFKILESFKESGVHEAIVLDEFGGVIGFITMNDIISEVVGDISLNQEPEPLQITQRDETSWLIDGLLPIDDFKEHFDFDDLPEENRGHYQTVGGFVTSYLGYIPAVAEKFHWSNYTIEIVDMDRARIDKILLTKNIASKEQEIAS